MKEQYEGYGPTFANEKLEERQEIKISVETLRKRMILTGRAIYFMFKDLGELAFEN